MHLQHFHKFLKVRNLVSKRLKRQKFEAEKQRFPNKNVFLQYLVFSCETLYDVLILMVFSIGRARNHFRYAILRLIVYAGLYPISRAQSMFFIYAGYSKLIVQLARKYGF